MVKIRTLSRSRDETQRELPTDLHRAHQRNLDPALHPFERAREYTRALNATKLDRLFAKPFVAALDGHADGVYALARHPRTLSLLLSGACDGEIKVWDIAQRKEACAPLRNAHRGFVRGLTVTQSGTSFLSCGNDATVKLWGPISATATDIVYGCPTPKLLDSWSGKHAFTAIDHQRGRAAFATAGGASVEVWDEQRAEPTHTFTWGCDTVYTCRFNPVETNVIASCGSDRAVTLYDTRTRKAMQRTVLVMKSNALAWNPIEAFNFTVANEDHNCYSFDMRKLDAATSVHEDHVSAVLDIDYSPTGQEFCTGSYDRTIRIFPARGGHSREVYHTTRMQRIFATRFSADAGFVLSGSDDHNIRLWKAQASAPLKTLLPREREKLAYAEKLRDRYGKLPEIRRIDKHRHVPKAIKTARRIKDTRKKAIQRREANSRKHDERAGKEPKKPTPERRLHVVTTQQ